MLEVGGLVPLSTTDFPDRLSAVVFLHGCPWRCAYCHNPQLQPRPARGELPWQSVLEFLDRRKGLLDAVVFSGGEPTLQASLARSIADVRRRGFAAGMHTAGIYPRRLASVLPSLDWVGLDIKARFEDYPRVTGRRTSAAAARESLDLLLASGKRHEVRTTWHPALLTADQLLRMAEGLARKGVRDFALQVFNPDGCNDAALRAQPRAHPGGELLASLSGLFERFTLRPQARQAA